jgi:hypothetical protein
MLRQITKARHVLHLCSGRSAKVLEVRRKAQLQDSNNMPRRSIGRISVASHATNAPESRKYSRVYIILHLRQLFFSLRPTLTLWKTENIINEFHEVCASRAPKTYLEAFNVGVKITSHDLKIRTAILSEAKTSTTITSCSATRKYIYDP